MTTGYKNPPRRTTPEIHLTPRNAISKRLIGRYRVLGIWQAVGAEIGITGGMAFRVAVDGYEPQKSTLRAALGLPITMPIPVCPRHGVVHVSRRCPPDKPATPRRPSLRARRKALWRSENWRTICMEMRRG